MELFRTVRSATDDLELDIVEVLPEGKCRGIVQIVHGMAEHKERYLDFMRFLARNGYACVAHDHRGHGKSVRTKEDLGYFYEETADAIVEDLLDVAARLRKDYPNAPFIVFGHSMGSLIVRKYLKKHDDTLDGLVISGAVFKNPAASAGKAMISMLEKLKGSKAVSPMIVNMVTGGFDKKIEGTTENRWLSENEDNVKAFNDDELCGFPFTLNGYKNLMTLIEDVYSDKGWNMKNPSLPIYFVAGKQDPVIGSEKEFGKTVGDLRKKGYRNVSSHLYDHMRHEILNETGRMQVYQDILKFLNDLTAGKEE